MTQAEQLAPAERSPSHSFSREEIARHRSTLDQAGYIVFRDVVPKDVMERVRGRLLEEYRAARTNGSLFSGGGSISGHLNCFPGEESRAVYDAVSDSGIVDLVRTLFPMATKQPNVGCNMNLPGSVAQHYHADGLFVEEFPIINVAVVDTDLQNGAIDVLPGTHTRFYKFWQYALGREYKKTTRIPMKQGDILVRTSTLWHRGMPNKTQVPRPMIAFTWEHGGKPEDGFKIHDGRIKFLPNWYKTDFLGLVRETTFVRVPISYSAYRLAKSLVGNKGYSEW